MEPQEGKMADTPRSDTISTKQARIAKLARQMPGTALTSLSHHIDLDWMYEAYRQTRKDGAKGVDGQGSEEFAQDLEGNLAELLNRAKSGSYRAPAVRRVYIPKDGGKKTRPIGIPTFADKVLQRAVKMVLEPVYEQDFLDCSYGFRPGRSQHQALQALWNGLMDMKGGWVLDLDIQNFFGELGHREVQRLLRQRVTDGVVCRLIGKWLNAGVMEKGSISYPERGTPQGGVISPLLSNIYLHEVLDQWFAKDVMPRLKGRAFMIRFADDAVLCFELEEDAHRVMAVLPKRLERFGLKQHPDKTRLVRFQRPPLRPPGRRAGPRPGTFDLLGFTHYWGRSRRGAWVIQRRTSRTRLSRALRAIAQWCRRNRHLPVKEQHLILVSKLRGHYNYYGITGNGKALAVFLHFSGRIWRKWLSRRSQRARMSWERFERLLLRYPLPPPVVVHSVYRRSANP
jgi:group II intron reverse transcriptase/maturase